MLMLFPLQLYHTKRDLLQSACGISDLYSSRNSLCDWIHTRPALDWLACGFLIAYIFIHADDAFTLTQHHVAASMANGQVESRAAGMGPLTGLQSAQSV